MFTDERDVSYAYSSQASEALRQVVEGALRREPQKISAMMSPRSSPTPPKRSVQGYTIHGWRNRSTEVSALGRRSGKL